MGVLQKRTFSDKLWTSAALLLFDELRGRAVLACTSTPFYIQNILKQYIYYPYNFFKKSNSRDCLNKVLNYLTIAAKIT